MKEVISFTKTGPYLIPSGFVIPEEGKTEPILTQIVNYFSSFLDSVTEAVEDVAGPYSTSLIMGVIFVLFVVIVWLVLDIIKFVNRDGKNKPEEIKTKSQLSEVGSSNLDVFIKEV
jgi:hypothetical protein